jgi:mRNA interferase HicA
MKRRDLIRHLTSHGCELLREGGRHSIYFNPRTGATSAVPRHPEVERFLNRKNLP